MQNALIPKTLLDCICGRRRAIAGGIRVHIDDAMTNIHDDVAADLGGGIEQSFRALIETNRMIGNFNDTRDVLRGGEVFGICVFAAANDR